MVSPRNPKGSAVEVEIVALVLKLDQSLENLVSGHFFADVELAGHLPVHIAGADAVDARDRSDDDDVGPGQERIGRGVTHAVDFFVNERIFLDIGVRRRDVGFGLVVVVVADEIVDRAVGEEFFELTVELGPPAFCWEQ